MIYERVYTMSSYYDGPREGIANMEGLPHVYRSMFYDFATKEPWAPAVDDIFALWPIDKNTLQLALEDWQIWCRWEDAFYEKALRESDKHPALAEDWPRHQVLEEQLSNLLDFKGKSIRYASAQFRPSSGRSHAARGRHLEACWELIEVPEAFHQQNFLLP